MERINDALALHESTGSPDKNAGRLSVDDYLKFVDETRSQPAFWAAMDKAADYYDGNQMTAEQLAGLDAMGFGSLMTNLIKPSVDTVLGLEAKNRTDFRCFADDEANQPVAEAMSAKLAEAERESRADRACSDAYGSQIKAGLGWVHVGRNGDPFQYPYRAESVHRREMRWDWSAKDPLLDDSRFILRQKWFPVDQVAAALPKHADLLRASAGGWQPDWMQRAMESTHLANAYDQENRMSVSAWDWRNIDQRRVALQECWYATYVRGLVLRSPDGKVVEFDKKNQLHMAAVGAGVIKPEPAVYRKLRCSIWFGPHRLQDYDAGRSKLPYVPFWGFREDLTGVPYGLVRSMIPLQDEVNARRRKLMWLLSSKRVQIDSDSLDARYNEFADVVNEIARPDSMLVLNPARKNADAVKVESDLALSAQQFEILQEAKEGIQAAAGIFNSIMGKTDGAKSGVAVNALVEQSSNTLGEINDNFKFSRKRVGEILVDMIKQDMSGTEVQVMVGSIGSKKKTIVLNKPAIDSISGMKYLENDTDRSNFKVALEDVPSTPAYRAQQMMTIGETMKSMPPELQAAMMPFYMEATDLPKRAEISKALRQAMGQVDENGEEMDPQVAQLKQQLQLVQQQSEEAMDQYEKAVQEESTKAQSATAQNQKLSVQLANKAGELELKQQEVAANLRLAELAAEERMAKVQSIQTEREIKEREFGLKEREFGLKEQELNLNTVAQSDAAARAEREHGLKADQMERDQLDGIEPEVDPKAIQEIVEKVVAPLEQKLEKTLADVKKRAEHESIAAKAKEEGHREAEKEAKKNAAKGDEKDPDEERRTEEMHRAKLAQTETQTKAIETGSKAKAGESKAKVEAVVSKTAEAAEAAKPEEAKKAEKNDTEKPKKKVRDVVFKKDANGRIVGARITEVVE